MVGLYLNSAFECNQIADNYFCEAVVDIATYSSALHCKSFIMFISINIFTEKISEGDRLEAEAL